MTQFISPQASMLKGCITMTPRLKRAKLKLVTPGLDKTFENFLHFDTLGRNIQVTKSESYTVIKTLPPGSSELFTPISKRVTDVHEFKKRSPLPLSPVPLSLSHI